MSNEKDGPQPLASLPVLEHTPGHVDCPACQQFGATPQQALTPDLIFETAAAMFMAMRARRPDGPTVGVGPKSVRLNTEKGYLRHTGALTLFFQGMKLSDIHWFHMRAYGVARTAGDRPFIRKRRPHDKVPTGTPVKPAQVNQELDFLKRLKKLALCWTSVDAEYYKLTKLQADEEDVRRALTPEEQQHWLVVSSKQTRWDIVHWYSIVAFDTTMNPGELRCVRLGDLNLAQKLVSIPWPSAKNKYRRRTIPIENADVLWAFERLLARAAALGCTDPQHYLFPFRDNRRKDAFIPDKPMSASGIKKLWEEVREATNLLWFRQNDTRHTAATRLAEKGTPIDIILARMGHVSNRMRLHYTHISIAAQRKWVGGGPSDRLQPAAARVTDISRRRTGA